ncbi:hypothetical protein HDK64DRAFT_78034 [Phyllosticta capitalensis]
MRSRHNRGVIILSLLLSLFSPRCQRRAVGLVPIWHLRRSLSSLFSVLPRTAEDTSSKNLCARAPERYFFGFNM